MVINKGSTQGVAPGSPVIDSTGLLGQTIRVFPLSSEVSLIDNPEYSVPILNTRSGQRGLAFGDGEAAQAGMLEVRFVSHNADFQVGDVLTTSGSGGIYPPGLPVGTVTVVERQSSTSFSRVQVKPSARPLALGYVLVLDPQPVVQQEAAAAADAASQAASAGSAP